VIHLYGGAVTIGAIDELIRHSITKLSHFHLVAHNDYKNRIKQLGEESKRIKNIYMPEIFLMKREKIISKQLLFDKFNFDIKKKIILVTYHPETLNQKNSIRNFNNMISVLLKLRMQVIFTYPNSDFGHRFIINKYKKLCSKLINFRLIENAGQNLYVNLLKNSDLMLGNSSSGIVEAASFKLPVINIGNRQTGKVKPSNVIDCDGSLKSLKAKISLGLSSKFKNKIKKLKNPYEKKINLKKLIKKIILESKNKDFLIKKFIDI
jgi:UDP-hydrolysing UDP-N-acetyl-D-glucosamine 2-epimerase